MGCVWVVETMSENIVQKGCYTYSSSSEWPVSLPWGGDAADAATEALLLRTSIGSLTSLSSLPSSSYILVVLG